MSNSSHQDEGAALNGAAEQHPKKLRKGFAAMSPEQRRAIASRGGKAVQAAGTAHRWTSETARAAGKIGGNATHVRRGRTPVDET